MSFSSMRYLTKQGLHNLALNRLMTFASIAVLSTCLFITGVAFLFTANLDSVVAYLGTQNETVVYLDPALDGTAAAQLEGKITAVEGVKSASLMTKADVLEQYRGYLDTYSDLWEEFETDNPFKANYRVVINNLENIDGVVSALEGIEGVVKVSAPVEMAGVFVQVQRIVTLAGYFLVGALGLVSVVVISNTVRLTVFARRREINIMKYVGATNGFIRWPFFVEGVTVGLISAVVACALTLGAYALVLQAESSLTGLWATLLEGSALPIAALAGPLAAGCLVLGVLVGGLGSVLSIRKHLQV